MRACCLAAVLLLAWTAGCDNPADAGDLADCLREHPDRVRDYAVGDVVTDTLGGDDCRFEDRSRLDVYRFTLAAPRTVTITLRSEDFDAYLVLADADSTVVSQNDDFELPASTDARIIEILPAGTYYIGVNSLDPREQGAYTLSSAAGPVAAPAADRASGDGPAAERNPLAGRHVRAGRQVRGGAAHGSAERRGSGAAERLAHGMPVRRAFPPPRPAAGPRDGDGAGDI